MNAARDNSNPYHLFKVETIIQLTATHVGSNNHNLVKLSLTRLPG